MVWTLQFLIMSNLIISNTTVYLFLHYLVRIEICFIFILCCRYASLIAFDKFLENSNFCVLFLYISRKRVWLTVFRRQMTLVLKNTENSKLARCTAFLQHGALSFLADRHRLGSPYTTLQLDASPAAIKLGCCADTFPSEISFSGCREKAQLLKSKFCDAVCSTTSCNTAQSWLHKN